MSTSGGLQEPQRGWETPAAKPLDEAAWHCVLFAALALLYNPVAPVFSFSGDWQRALLIASAIPFGVSLTWRKQRLAHND